jgi:3-oxoacyl-[acyl-carrier-protein] synthase II
MEKRRVVITGLGAVTPLGNDVESTFSALLEGKSGAGPITAFDATGYDTTFACEVKGFQIDPWADKKEARRMDNFVQYGVASAGMALKDAGLDLAKENLERIGVLVGSGIGGLRVIEAQHKVLLEKGPSRVNPFLIPMLISNMAPGQIAIQFGLKGPNSCVATACATGNHAIGDAMQIVARGDADVMVAGGTESTITPLAVSGFNAARALSTRNAEPTLASRPFDSERDGFVMGEGAGILILEELERAKARGARIYAEILGYGLSDDAFHMTAPPEDGEGGARAMKMALGNAHLNPQDVDYINAHGTSTPVGDKAETRAIKAIFGDHAISKKAWVSSTKSMTGHLLGAAGGVEAVVCVKTLQTGKVHPTINLTKPDPECDLDYVPLTARERQVRTAVSNSFGFGGHNASLVFSRFAG